MEVLQLFDVLASIFANSAHCLCEVVSVHIATESGLMTDTCVGIVNFILTKMGKANPTTYWSAIGSSPLALTEVVGLYLLIWLIFPRPGSVLCLSLLLSCYLCCRLNCSFNLCPTYHLKDFKAL